MKILLIILRQSREMEIMKSGIASLFIGFFLTITFLTLSYASASCSESLLKWKKLPPLPPAPGQNVQIGLAGTFAGVHNDVLILAGGANFPDGPPWEGGQKVWYNDIYVLQRDQKENYHWLTDSTFKLPIHIAYGVSITTEKGIIIVGGCDAEKCYSNVFLLQWNISKRSIDIKSLPSLPLPLAFMSGALAGNTICIAGGQETMDNARATGIFFTLDLSQENNPVEFQWQEQPCWPGPPRILAVAAGLNTGCKGKFFLFSGRDIAPDKPILPLTDAYCFDLNNCEWQRLADINYRNELRCVMAATAASYGNDQILIFGGSDGKLDLEISRLEFEISNEKDISNNQSLNKKLKQLLNTHRGFSKDILSYNISSNIWTGFGSLPTTSHVTTSIVRWNNNLIIPSGEIRPGIRTSEVWKCSYSIDPILVNIHWKAARYDNPMRWSDLVNIPQSIGYKDAFTGIEGKPIIIAGGASVSSFKKSSSLIFHDAVLFYQMNEKSSYPLITEDKLDHLSAFGATVSTDFRVISIGGRDAKHLYSDIYYAGIPGKISQKRYI